MRTQFNGKTENNIPKYKSVCNNLLPTDYDQVKGKAVNISAKKVDVSPTTLRKVIKIKKVAKEDPEIKKKWEKAKANEEETEDKLSIESIYREIKKKEKKEKTTEKGNSNSNNKATCKDCKRIISFSAHSGSQNCIFILPFGNCSKSFFNSKIYCSFLQSIFYIFCCTYGI